MSSTPASRGELAAAVEAMEDAVDVDPARRQRRPLHVGHPADGHLAALAGPAERRDAEPQASALARISLIWANSDSRFSSFSRVRARHPRAVGLGLVEVVAAAGVGCLRDQFFHPLPAHRRLLDSTHRARLPDPLRWVRAREEGEDPTGECSHTRIPPAWVDSAPISVLYCIRYGKTDTATADQRGLGATVRAERERRGVSQSALARRTGVPQPAISRIEGGRGGSLAGALRAAARGTRPAPRAGPGSARRRTAPAPGTPPRSAP